MKHVGKFLIMVCVCVALFVSYARGNGVQPDEAAAAEQSERCLLVPEPGPCKAMFEKYYYNPQSKKCDVFFYGGCQGVVPFETMEECAAACENPADLRISRIEADNDLPFAVLDVEYPKDGDEPEFSITVNGEKAVVTELGGGFDQESRDKTFLIALGENGKKEILVTAAMGANVLTAKTDYYWNANPRVQLLAAAEGRTALFEQTDLTLFAFGVGDVKLLFNGEPVQSEQQAIDAVRGNLLKIKPSWKPGRNTLSVEAKISESNSMSKQYDFYYMPDGKLAKGETVSLVYGYPGSKSGPFFSFETDSKSIRLTDRGEVREYMINEEGWLWPDYKLIADVEGVDPGAALLKIYQKPHFTMDRELDKEIKIEVVP